MIITVENLVTHYADKKILDGVDFCVRQGEIMVIMGGSGSGKSTLLRHLLGLDTPTSGTIHVNDVDIVNCGRRELTTLRKKIGVAFQGGALLSSLSVGDNVKLPLRQLTNLDENTISIMSRLKLELMNLVEVEDLMPSELSGGMLKRVGLARAVVMDPRILFFDEPSAGLDPVTSVELDELILKLRAAMNMTIVVVTHELLSAFKIADKITVLFDGQVAICGTVDDIKNCQDSRIQNMIHRRPRTDVVDPDQYFNRLTR